MARKMLGVLLLAFCGVASAADTNKVEGSYVVDNKATQLKYAYSIKEKLAGKSYKTLLFSAAPVSADDLKAEDPFQLFSDEAGKGQVQALEVLFSDDKTIKSVRIYDKAFDGAFQTGGDEKFEATRFDAGGIGGKITMDRSHKFFDQTYQYNLTFSVALTP